MGQLFRAPCAFDGTAKTIFASVYFTENLNRHIFAEKVTKIRKIW
jgi:hypothetical protein